MPELSKQLAAIAITQTYAKLWLTGLEPGAQHMKVVTSEPHERHHPGRVAMGSIADQGHDPEFPSHVFYEEIAQAIAKAPQILLLGHGKGKANTVSKFVNFLEEKHPQTAGKVAGTININLQAMTDPEILAMSRDWYAQHIKSGI